MKSQKKSYIKLYRHYKNKPYKYIGEVRHSETLEELVLYQTRYENQLGSTWVRPKKMFFENVEVNGEFRPRFKQVEIKIETSTELTAQKKEDITALLCKAFDKYDPEYMDSRLKNKSGILVITAYEDKDFIGCKLGYRLNNNTFYSWLGAVDFLYRGMGLGRELMEQQHIWCRDNGYEVIVTKTMNESKNMLQLNIQNGFEITGTEKSTDGELKILMAKRIK